MSPASQKRIERFVDWFIRTDYVSNWQAGNREDFISDSDRANRCYNAAGDGADGSTHREVINDWREAFTGWLRDDHRSHNDGLFVDAVNAHFDSVEEYHTKAGTVDQQVG